MCFFLGGEDFSCRKHWTQRQPIQADEVTSAADLGCYSSQSATTVNSRGKRVIDLLSAPKNCTRSTVSFLKAAFQSCIRWCNGTAHTTSLEQHTTIHIFIFHFPFFWEEIIKLFFPQQCKQNVYIWGHLLLLPIQEKNNT